MVHVTVNKNMTLKKINILEYAFGEVGGGHQKAYAVYAFINVDNCERPLMNKIDDLSVFMYENDPDVVFVTESWTSSDTLDSQLCMTGYELYRFDRRYRKGGGCIIYAKNDLNVQ